jgi:hypothetical protein
VALQQDYDTAGQGEKGTFVQNAALASLANKGGEANIAHRLQYPPEECS